MDNNEKLTELIDKFRNEVVKLEDANQQLIDIRATLYIHFGMRKTDDTHLSTHELLLRVLNPTKAK